MLNYFNFLAGIVLLLLGIRCLRRGSERFFGARLRRLMQAASQNRLRALLTGLFISILAPSSTAVTLLAVEAITAGYMTFQQVLALMLGANIGFTAMVQLLAFKFYNYHPFFLVLGVPIYLFSRRVTWRGGGQAIMGIGFLLLAIQLMSLAVSPLKSDPDVANIVQILEKHPVWLMWFAVGLAVVLQSPTAAIGIAIAMCDQGILPVKTAVAVAIGANIGIAVTALIAGFRAVNTRRMALGNLLFKLVGAAACMPLLAALVTLIDPLSMVGPTHDTQVVANMNSLFNVAIAVVFLPLVPFVARGLEQLVPEKESDEQKTGPRYLDPSSLESPPLALGQATREVLNLADHVRSMLRDAQRALREGDETLCGEVQKHDDIVDMLNGEIKNYLTKISDRALTPDEARREMAILTFSNELEGIGDIVDKNLIDLARKKISLHCEFSAEGRADLESFYQKVLENFEIAVSAFASQDRVLAEQLVRHKRHLNELEPELRNRHFRRLHAGLAESVETSSVHLDVLTNLKHINSLLTAVAYSILETKAGA